MIDENKIEFLLRRVATEAASPRTASAEQLHAKIISGEKSRRRLRRSVWYGIVPVSAALGLFSMWLMALPSNWIALASLANLILLLLFAGVAKWIAK